MACHELTSEDCQAMAAGNQADETQAKPARSDHRTDEQTRQTAKPDRRTNPLDCQVKPARIPGQIVSQSSKNAIS
jgi:hypothetical protein